MQRQFTETTTELARKSGTTAALIRKYAAANWLEFIVASDGTRLFREGQEKRVREIYKERMQQRGRRAAP